MPLSTTLKEILSGQIDPKHQKEMDAERINILTQEVNDDPSNVVLQEELELAKKGKFTKRFYDPITKRDVTLPHFHVPEDEDSNGTLKTINKYMSPDILEFFKQGEEKQRQDEMIHKESSYKEERKSIPDFEDLNWSDLIEIRKSMINQEKLQKEIAPYEHRAFARELTEEYPFMAIPLSLAIPAYQGAKILGIAPQYGEDNPTPPDWKQVTEGYKGISEGLRKLMIEEKK